VFDMFFCVYFCMFPVCPLCCFILISMDLESEINDDDDDIIPFRSYRRLLIKFCSNPVTLTQNFRYKGSPPTNHFCTDIVRPMNALQLCR